MDNRELLWRQYNLNVDLFKHYLKITIEFNVFYYAITGAIVSYYLSNASNQPLMRYALLLPICMSVLFSAFFFWGAVLMTVSRKETFDIRDALGLKAAPELGVLCALLAIFATLMIVVAGALAWLYFQQRSGFIF